MGENMSFPESVSYKQLASWLQQAPADPSTPEPEPRSANNGAQTDFEVLLERWSQCGVELLAAFKDNGKAISEGRSPRQIMALGALQAHLAMALQARAASGRPHE